jgi:hypothetical protein
MHITLLNAEPDSGSAFQSYLRDLAETLTGSGHTVETLVLRDLHLAGCSGCFGCWLRTPGECLKRDDSARICRLAMGSDLLLLASPVRLGFTSSLLKAAVDQMIPLVHPYFMVQGGEIHHLPRYRRYPGMALLLDPGPDCDAGDLELTRTIWARTARNLKASSFASAVADRPVQETAHALTAAA